MTFPGRVLGCGVEEILRLWLSGHVCSFIGRLGMVDRKSVRRYVQGGVAGVDRERDEDPDVAGPWPGRCILLAWRTGT